MKFASLTTTVISAAAMAGIARAPALARSPPTIADSDDTTSPINRPCTRNNLVQCSTGMQGYNDGNDYRFFCGSDWRIIPYTSCSCKNCCKVIADGNDFQCRN
ncbi:uncharacterized protein BJ212DRAFT_129609 [Suillus subaureus]|uniref:Uncharacterized protein n=1 Tax=Suillus subaureus TaxID=48587 RepID=A0A9P7EDL0_9AGAM|nr:uncharacterized protein BJ212DRAFT_129609 [Suillus subaureus]KAG1818188.1 hypothetical protein BJ212DRAFT_129609 [Suillus subaureus]